MMKAIVLCADDYGQAPPISKGIINLIDKGRLSATSCMVNSDYWPLHARWLLPFRQQIDIGLHFNLTEGKALSKTYRLKYGEYFPGLGKVLRLGLMRSFPQTIIEAELHAQIDEFQKALGFLPSHIDGHQHIHQFAVIRDAVVTVYNQRLHEHKAYIRSIHQAFSPNDILSKKLILHLLGALAFKKILKSNQIPHNQSFSGIYSFSGNYQTHFQGFLRKINDKGLIMCHPGLSSSEARDSIATARFAEYQYFASNQFISDCRAQEVAISQFK